MSGRLKDAVRARARELGFDDCRFAGVGVSGRAAAFRAWLEAGCHGEMAYLARDPERRVDPERVLSGARTVICLAASYDRPGTGVPKTGGEVARYARHADYHDVLAAPLRALAEHVDALGGPGTRSRAYVDTGPVLERDLAERAGLGFVGKHTGSISRALGNWFFLAEILTTLELAPDPPERNRCGTCTRCLTACPTGALTGPFRLDARRCISYLTIELKGPIPQAWRPALGRRIFGCDDCLAACPWNRFAREGHLLRAHARSDLDQVDLLELLALDAAGFRARFAGTPLLRVKRRGLLRNVCVALGNTGDAAALTALERAASDAEPLVAEHAAWALERIRERLGGWPPDPPLPRPGVA